MALYLEEYIDSIENLPSEIKHYFAEIRHRNEAQASKKTLPAQLRLQIQINHSNVDLKKAILEAQKQCLKETPQNSSSKSLEKLENLYSEVKALSREKIGISEKAQELLLKHIKRLDDQIIAATKNIEDQGLPVYETSIYDDSGAISGRASTSSVRKQKKSSRAFNMGMLSGMEDIDALDDSFDEDGGEPVYCICQQESFGEMIACDNADGCSFEWFHYGCVGLSAPPQGAWYCPICAPKFKKKKF